jgi:hypothetical protein
MSSARGSLCRPRAGGHRPSEPGPGRDGPIAVARSSSTGALSRTTEWHRWGRSGACRSRPDGLWISENVGWARIRGRRPGASDLSERRGTGGSARDVRKHRTGLPTLLEPRIYASHPSLRRCDGWGQRPVSWLAHLRQAGLDAPSRKISQWLLHRAKVWSQWRGPRRIGLGACARQLYRSSRFTPRSRREGHKLGTPLPNQNEKEH